ncbi:hypothetical protein KIN20_032743 [Parelaphostrongylus tenuis]|uniref:Uncharacterized protein n=1 Tax=Parelaphostrongylus tenuis TaxID=148309 RepID=A0AAD5R781_PARTN|nr:hypothetical protein KIN20_032743 [Parelaphostrongylus tenuis]
MPGVPSGGSAPGGGAPAEGGASPAGGAPGGVSDDAGDIPELSEKKKLIWLREL